jgi:hypothetical protein
MRPSGIDRALKKKPGILATLLEVACAAGLLRTYDKSQSSTIRPHWH